MEGTMCSTVTRWRLIRSATYRMSLKALGMGTISRAPSDNVRKMSDSDASKLTDDDCSHRSSAVTLHSAMKPATCSAIA